MDLTTMTHRVLPMSKAKLIFGCTFIVFVISAIAIFMAFQSDSFSYDDNGGATDFESELAVPLGYAHDSFAASGDSETDTAIGISDFGRRLDVVDEELRSVKQSISQLKDELSNYKNTAAEVSQSLGSQLQALKNRLAELSSANSTLSDALNQTKMSLGKIETQRLATSQSALPVVGLKLLSVSIWDDGAVAIVALGNRNTALSVGNFFAGLKVEDMSVAEQSLTLYEPAADKLYTLYADAIVYKEVHAQ